MPGQTWERTEQEVVLFCLSHSVLGGALGVFQGQEGISRVW